MTDRVSAFNELLKAGCLAYNRLCRDYDDVEKGLNTYLDAVLAIRLSRSSVERQRGILSFVETMVRLEDMETKSMCYCWRTRSYGAFWYVG